MSDKKPELVVLCAGVWPIFGFARDELESAADNFEGGVLGYWRFWPSALEERGYETLILKQPPLGGQEACATEAIEQVRPHVEAGRPLILIGHSRGGWIVRAVACEFPENTRVCTTIATPQTGQWLADFHLAMGEEDPDSLMNMIEGRVDQAVEEGTRSLKELIKTIGRMFLPDDVRQAIRNALGRAREVHAELADDFKGALAYIQEQGGDWDQIYADYNTPASVAANKALPNQDNVVYINVLGELEKDGFVPPELSTSTVLLELVSTDAVLPPFGSFRQLASTFQKQHMDGYGSPVQGFEGPVVRYRKHDGATHADCCVIPWGHKGPEWASDNPSTSLTWKLDHCRQVGLFPSRTLEGYIHGLVDHWEQRRAEMDSANG